MASKVNPVPEGFHTATPYMIIKGAAEAIEFYKKAFGATELTRHADPGGKVRHAEIKIGDSHVMLADECPEMGYRSAQAVGDTPVSLMLYVQDADEVVKKAVAGDARVLQPVKDQFYGDRSGNIQDPFGHKWTIATHKEDVPPEELKKRAAALFAQH